MRKTLTLLALVFFTLSAFALPALAAPTHQVVFVIGQNRCTTDGQEKTIDAAAFIENDRTYVPVRYMAYALGVAENDVVWQFPNVLLRLGGTEVNLTVNNKTLYINSNPKQMDVPVLDRGGRAYLPARWVAEAFGYKVDWKPENQAVLIYPSNQNPPDVPELSDKPNWEKNTDKEVKYFQNGVITQPELLDYKQDIKKLTKSGNCWELEDFPWGCRVDIPVDMNIDLKYSPAFVRVFNKDLDVKISKEHSPYFDMEMYFRDYLNRTICNPQYQKSNLITIVDDKWIKINGYKTRLVSFYRTPANGSPETQNQYIFAYMITGDREFHNFFFRTSSLEKHKDTAYQILKSFKKTTPIGVNKYNVDLSPVLPKWNKETMDFYNELCSARKVMWGIFCPRALTDNYSKVSEIEEKLEYKFSILLHYMYINHPFPMEGMNEAYKRGQIVELTMQIAAVNNDNSPTHNANFDVIDGKYDNEIHELAKSAKSFGHPFLFRLNNEMNTDWCQYSGVLLLSDADIYIKVWQRIYNIFQQEGVDNAIWVFNPNSSSYPPTNWNSHISYYPGNEYIQVLGVTGYNTGDYFKNVTGEKWRTFDEIYRPMAEQYRQVYSKFPWVITEFSCSSIGGDKEKWIRDMFRSLPDYPEIKAALWWSHFDPDYRKGKENIPARRYWLDEKESYLQAFKEGLRS